MENNKFEVGKYYYSRFACDYDSISIIKITRRTDKSVWFVYDYQNGDKPRRAKIHTDNAGEYIIPDRYSMACVYHADHEYTPEPEPAPEQIEAEREQERHEVQRQIDAGREYIQAISAQYPIADGDPVVTIQWSEHPAFYSWEDGELKLSVAAAEIILLHYDKERHAENVADGKGGYDKTKFTITYISDNGEPGTYEGSYVLGR